MPRLLAMAEDWPSAERCRCAIPEAKVSVRLMAVVWDQFPGGGSQLLVLLKLADFANDAGGNIYPSIATLARYARSTERQVQRIMQGLIEDNWIEVVAHASGGRGKAREYRLKLDRLCEPKKGDTDVTVSRGKGDVDVTVSYPEKGDASVTHSEQKGDIRDTKRVTSRVVKGDMGVTPSVKNQQLEPKNIIPYSEGIVSGHDDGPETSRSADVSSCPAKKIVEIYHEVLPELPRVKVMTGQRERHLRSRWREDRKRQNLDWWRRYFQAVRASDFLMGKTDRPFVPDFGWLVKPENLAKVIEGRYANRQGGNNR
jgi:hypothetical protein